MQNPGSTELVLLLAVAGPVLWALADAVLARRPGWAVVLLLCLPAFPIGWFVAVYYLVAQRKRGPQAQSRAT